LARAVAQAAVEAQLPVLALLRAAPAVLAQPRAGPVVLAQAEAVVVALPETVPLDPLSHRSFSAGTARISPTTQQPTCERVPRSR